MTDSEQALWRRVRGKQIRGVQFYRQRPLGSFIVDFYAPSAHLVVEVDGSQHQDLEGLRRDAKRDAYLTGLGLRVLRFDDRQVLVGQEAVLEAIDQAITGRAEQIPPDPPLV